MRIIMEYKFIPPPEKASVLQPSEARSLFRRNGYYGPTSGFCRGYTQANIIVLPKELADDFEEFCKRNSGPFPLLYKSQPGECTAPPLARESDIKTDLPRYYIYSKGGVVEDILDLSGFEDSWADRVTFYLGCSFTFEMALNNHGIPMKNMNLGRNASMYLTNIGLKQAGAFNADMIVTMRPIRKSQISEAFLISAQYPTSHGAPVHMGNPGRIGVTDLGQPTAGDTCEVEEDEVPVFWACGFTVSQAVMNAAPQLAFTHYSGSMFITDIQAQPKSIGDDFDVVVLSREHQPFFASVLEKRSVNTMHKLEKAILDDQGGRGVSHLYQESDLLKSVLSLSHAKRVAITTGFPVHTELEVKEETDGLPGALSICQALLALDKEVILIADSGTVGLYQSCADHMTELKVLKSAVKVIPYSSAVEILQNGRPDSPPWDCLLAIERAGRAKDGSYHTMKAKTVSVEPVDDLFIMAESNPLISTISIGDGGNELGMGKVYEQVVKYIPHGETIACTTATDFVIVAGVSNWAGYAVSLGLYVLSHSPIHWRYRNHAVDTDRIVTYELDNFLPTGDKITSLLKLMNENGISDGITGKKDLSVDGLPLQVHLDKVTELKNIVQ